jgi:FkbM family methyltransferase
MFQRHYDGAVRHVLSTIDHRVPVKAHLANGMRVVVPWNDDGGRAICDAGLYEPVSVELFERLLRPGMVVVDAGANVGQYTLLACSAIGDGGRVISFEPDPVTFDWLRRNCELNRLRNVSLHQRAVYDERTSLELHLASTRDSGSNSLVAEPWISESKTVRVDCVRLDDVLASEGVHRVDVIKVDIEGAELAALRGAEQTLRAARPVLVVEFEEERQRASGHSCAELAMFLEGLEYDLFRMGIPPLRYEPGPFEPPSLNVLAIPTEQVASILARLESPPVADRPVGSITP